MAVGALQGAAPGKLRVSRPRVRARVLLVTVAVSLVTALVGVQFVNAQAEAALGYRAAAARLNLGIGRAEAAGYSSSDLAPTVDAVRQDGGLSAPLFFQQAGSYRQRAAHLDSLLAQLPAVEAAALARHRSAADTGIGTVDSAIAAAVAQGVDDEVVASLRSRENDLRAALAAAANPRAVDAVAGRAAGVAADANAAGAAAAAEQAQLKQAADALKAQYAGNVDQLRGAASGPLTTARNDATVGSLLKIAGADKVGHRVEHYAALLGNADVDQVALGAAGVQSLQVKMHNTLVAGLPRRTIVVSLAAQELWAFQEGKVVQDSLVTTGRPELPTDVGAMKVLSKDSPWKMHSPWPKGNPHWYPDTMVQKVVWFTVTGEGLHDASWEPLSYYGPGGQNSSAASHGCIHVPNAANDFLYNWAPVGTPVIVYPGDGAPLTAQLAKVSVDSDGVPLTGPKGS